MPHLVLPFFAIDFFADKKLFILVSQSGETADTMCALQKIKNNGGNTIAFVNNPKLAQKHEFL